MPDNIDDFDDEVVVGDVSTEDRSKFYGENMDDMELDESLYDSDSDIWEDPNPGQGGETPPPPGDKPTDEPGAKDTNKPAAAATTQTGDNPAAAPVVEQDFDKLLFEKTGGKFKTLADLEQVQKPVYKNPLAEQLDNFLAEGRGDINKFLEFQNLDVDSLDELDVLRKAYRLEHPDISDEALTEFLESEYSQTEYASDHAKQVGKIKLARDVKNAKEALRTYRDSVAPATQNPEGSQQLRQEYEQKLAQDIESFNAIPVTFEGETDPFILGLTPEDKKAILADAKNLVDAGFWSQVAATEDGQKIDTAKLFKAIYVVKNWDKAIKLISDNALTRAELKIRDKIDNTQDFRERPGFNDDSIDEDWQDALGAHVRKHGR